MFVGGRAVTIRFLLSGATIGLLAAAPVGKMGGLPLRVAHGGAMNGLVDTSPLARSEVALRANAHIKDIRIVPEGWQITVDRDTDLPFFARAACGILIANRIPPGVRVNVATQAKPPRRLAVTCTGK